MSDIFDLTTKNTLDKMLEMQARIKALELELAKTFKSMMAEAKRVETLEAALRDIADGAIADNADDACYILMKKAKNAVENKHDRP